MALDTKIRQSSRTRKETNIAKRNLENESPMAYSSSQQPNKKKRRVKAADPLFGLDAQGLFGYDAANHDQDDQHTITIRSSKHKKARPPVDHHHSLETESRSNKHGVSPLSPAIAGRSDEEVYRSSSSKQNTGKAVDHHHSFGESVSRSTKHGFSPWPPATAGRSDEEVYRSSASKKKAGTPVDHHHSLESEIRSNKHGVSPLSPAITGRSDEEVYRSSTSKKKAGTPVDHHHSLNEYVGRSNKQPVFSADHGDNQDEQLYRSPSSKQKPGSPKINSQRLEQLYRSTKNRTAPGTSDDIDSQSLDKLYKSVRNKSRKQSPLVKQLLASDSEDGQENVSSPNNKAGKAITSRRLNFHETSSSDSEDGYSQEQEAVGPLVRRNNKPWEAQEPLSDRILMCLLQGMKDLTSFHRRNQHVRMPSNSELDEERDLPITSDDDFDLIEERLAIREYKEAMVQKLFLIGGADYKKMVFNLMNHVIDKKLASEYTFDGKSGKKAFGKKRILNVVKVAVQRRFAPPAEATDVNINKRIGRCLTEAKDSRVPKKRALREELLLN